MPFSFMYTYFIHTLYMRFNIKNSIRTLFGKLFTVGIVKIVTQILCINIFVIEECITFS